MSNETKQTAVDWFLHKVIYLSLIKFVEEQAKEMEKERMIEFASWLLVGSISNEYAKKKAEHYYKHYYEQTYGGNK